MRSHLRSLSTPVNKFWPSPSQNGSFLFLEPCFSRAERRCVPYAPLLPPLLGFAWFYSSESGLINGLSRFPNKNFLLAFLLPAERLARRPVRAGDLAKVTRFLIFAEELLRQNFLSHAAVSPASNERAAIVGRAGLSSSAKQDGYSAGADRDREERGDDGRSLATLKIRMTAAVGARGGGVSARSSGGRVPLVFGLSARGPSRSASAVRVPISVQIPMRPDIFGLALFSDTRQLFVENRDVERLSQGSHPRPFPLGPRLG
jgi:hypothetical protein